MAITLSCDDFFEAMPELFSAQSPRTFGQTALLQAYGNVTLTHFNTGNGIAYGAFEGMFHEEMHLQSLEMKEQSFLYFNLGDDLCFKSINDKKAFSMRQNSMIQGTIHEGLHSLGIYEKQKRYSCHTLIVDKALLDSLHTYETSLTPGYFQINTYQNMAQNQRVLLEHILKQKELLGPLQELYLESKLLELVYQTFHNTSVHVCTKLCQDDCKSLHKAEQILLGNLSNPPSLKALSHQCAINEFKLKQGFKELFGTTVYGLVHIKRLEKAKELLEKQEISVQEAALHVGYKSLSHFSKAFKERYGIFPSELKKERKYYR
ncbi:helix-turn-helix transcriptional regulator [Sulfurospirillum halorespirans]|nr:AraC family transcriptional regulator [Sulfurospirillum halorespirans]